MRRKQFDGKDPHQVVGTFFFFGITGDAFGCCHYIQEIERIVKVLPVCVPRKWIGQDFLSVLFADGLIKTSRVSSDHSLLSLVLRLIPTRATYGDDRHSELCCR